MNRFLPFLVLIERNKIKVYERVSELSMLFYLYVSLHLYYLHIFVISYMIFLFSRIVEFHFHFYSFKSSMTCVKKRSTDPQRKALNSSFGEFNVTIETKFHIDQTDDLHSGQEILYWIEGTPPLERIQHIEIKELVDLSHQTDQRHRAWDTQAGELIWPGRPDERDWFKAKALCQLAYKIDIWIGDSSHILLISPFVQAIQGLLALLLMRSTAKPRLCTEKDRR